MSKHNYVLIHYKTAARERVRNNLEALQVIAHCKQHGFIQKQDRREIENTSFIKSIGAKAKIKAGIRKIKVNWTFCRAWSSSVARN